MPTDPSGNYVPKDNYDVSPEDSPGFFGLSQHSVNMYKPDASQYANPYESQNFGYLDDYTKSLGMRNTPYAKSAQLGTASTSSDPYLAPAATYAGATINQGMSNEDRAYQMALMKQLQGEASGTAPSIAEMQMKQGLQGSLANQMAAAASTKGTDNPALAQRNLAMGAASGEQDLVGRAAVARMQEQQMAQQQLGALSSSVRGADIGLAGQQAALDQQAGMFNAGNENQFSLADAGFEQSNNQFNASAKNQYGLQQGQFDQQAALANQQSALAMYGMMNQGQQWALGQRMGMGEADRQAAMQYEQLMAQQSAQEEQLKAQSFESAASRQGKFEGGLLSGFGDMMALSDEQEKTNIDGGSGAGGGFMGFLRRYTPSESAGGGSGATGEPSISQFVDQDKAAYAQRMNAAPATTATPAASTSSGGGGGLDMGSMMSIAGASGMLSDEDEKFDLADTKGRPYGSVREMLQKTGTHSYRYKDPSKPGAAPGMHYGPMAQELEESDVGKSLVIETPYGKMVDTGRSALVGLSAAAMHERRIANLEKKMRSNGP